MSMRYEIVYATTRFCAVREIQQEDAVELVCDLLNIAGQGDDYLSDEEERKEIRANVGVIYGRVLGYET